MKIKKKYLLVVIALLGISAVNVFYNSQINGKSPSLALTNLKAIAEETSAGESDIDSGRGNKVECYCSFSELGSGKLTVYDCGPCTHVLCVEATDKRTCRFQ